MSNVRTAEPSFINTLNKSLVDIRGWLKTDPANAIWSIYQLLAVVEPAKQESLEDYPLLKGDCLRHINARRAIGSPLETRNDQLQNDYDIEHIGDYHDLYFRLYAIFWKCGYFNFATFTQFHDPSLGRRSGDGIVYATRRNK